MNEAAELSEKGQIVDDAVPETSDFSTGASASEILAGSGLSTVEPALRLDPTPTQMKMDASSEPAEGSPENVHSPTILYTLEYKNINTGNIIFTKEFNEPQSVHETLVSGKIPVLEEVTEILSFQKADLSKDEEDSKLAQPTSVHSIAGTRLKINSPAIVAALQSVVEYYPGYSFLEETVTIAEPYAILIHHEEELASYRKKFAPGTSLSDDQKCERKRDTYEHLGILEKYLQDRMGPSVLAERQRHARGRATFEMLWLLYRPGSDVYLYFDGHLGRSAAVIESTYEPRRVYTNVHKLCLWNMQYNGKYLGRERDVRYLSRFDGEKEITKLQVFPCQFLHEDTAQEGFKSQRAQIEERGKMYWRLTRKHCMHYTGLTSTFPQEYYDDMFMVDQDTFYFKFCREEDIPVLDDPSYGTVSGISDCFCRVCLRLSNRAVQNRKSPFSGYDEIENIDFGELTAHQYFLCRDSCWAYHLKSHTWKKLEVSKFSEPRFNTAMIDKLVMPDDRRNLIKSLAKNYVEMEDAGQKRIYERWTADFVPGKGEGKIFLLHGKPGVGKTYTAECIAQYTKRPLLSLTTADIGVDPKSAETSLNFYFDRAKLWDAVLLIDEADIFMERRENMDLGRNGLVSAFLRAMENCQSILFLTTNRVGAFDDAFISRIHISLYYPDFTEEDRKQVWNTFFEKLEDERGEIMRVPIGTKDYTEGQEVKALKWNGREIRNAFQTAVALADYEADKKDGKILLKDKHIMQIVRMSREFKTYLDTLHKGNESKRAQRANVRYDEYDERMVMSR